MRYAYLSEPITVKTIKESPVKGEFEIGGLYTGYGLTITNALRRVLLSSIPGYAITQFRIKGVDHEFSTVPGLVENIVDLTLNLKQIRLKMLTDEPQTLTLKTKGEKEITAGDIEVPAQVKILNPELHVATLSDKSASLEMELVVEKGLGYWPVENRKSEKAIIGLIQIDSLFSPVLKVSYDVESMRVGERADFNRVKMTIETDGSLTPSSALHKAAKILVDHFTKIGDLIEVEAEEVESEAEKETDSEKAEGKKKTTKKSKSKK